MTYNYFIHQFSVSSTVSLPAHLNRLTNASDPALKLQIRRSSLDAFHCSLRQIKAQTSYDIGHGIIVNRGRTAVYVNFAADEIILDVEDEFLPDAIYRALGTGVSACTLFTSGLPLFVSSMTLDGRLFGVFGDPDTGKSTLLWFLLSQDANFAGDDMLPVSFVGSSYIAYPAMSLHLQLRTPTLEHMGINPDDLHIIMPGIDKFWFPLPAERQEAVPQPLSALFLLQPDSIGNNSVTIIRVPEADAVQVIEARIHSKWLADKYIKPERLWKQCEILASSVPVYEIAYNRCFEILPRLAEAIRVTLNHPVQTEAIF